jgi:hypothetical protein
MMNNNNNENDVDVTLYKLRIQKFLIKLAQRIRTSVTSWCSQAWLVFFIHRFTSTQISDWGSMMILSEKTENHYSNDELWRGIYEFDSDYESSNETSNDKV